MAEKVSFICKRTVISTKPVQPGKYHALSVLDRAMEHNQVKLVYYYRTKCDKEFGEMTKMLIECLSETLTSYPMVTGRLVRDEGRRWMVKCNDAGVRMVEARAKGSVDEWLQDVDREKELMLIHWEDMYYKPYFWSTFYVQITEFEEGGLAIGLSCTHLLADPICLSKLIKAWAHVTLTGETTIPPPLFSPLPSQNRGQNSTNNILLSHYKSSTGKSVSIDDVKFTTLTLAFSDQMVRACMAMARASGPFEALAGLFWFCISKVKGVKEGLMKMSICLDMRKKIGLGQGYFGNCMVYNKVHANGFKEDELIIEGTKAIKKMVRQMDGDGVMDLIEWLKSTDAQHCPSMNGCDLICVDLEGVEPYSTVFEEGVVPIRASYYIDPVFRVGQVMILPSQPGEGLMSRVVIVTLPEGEAVMLIKDDLIRQLSPHIVMGANDI